ncbi:MAG: ATP synthase F1 subunit delta [Nitrospirae bacterium]|nr:ATP synthase F1 subunit delta [Candidatus Troglogloeales bacterium]MBI3598729.1 ATP synthase F1 subunit delta [Candidatus Troglogloeales bacterium]
MKSEIIASRYAQALLAFASGYQAQERVLEQIEWYEKVAAVSVAPLLANPKIPKAVKEGLIARLFAEDTNKILFYFIRLLLRKGRVAYLKEIFSLYPKQYELERGVVKGTLLLAYPIANHLVERLQSKLESKIQRRLSLKVVENTRIIGGFIFSTGTELIDASLKRVLADLGNQLKAVPVL